MNKLVHFILLWGALDVRPKFKIYKNTVKDPFIDNIQIKTRYLSFYFYLSTFIVIYRYLMSVSNVLFKKCSQKLIIIYLQSF